MLSIKIGVKSFEILVGDLRKTISEDVIQVSEAEFDADVEHSRGQTRAGPGD
jgi:hypothetical protein